MPTAEIIGYVITHTWDDGSGEEIKITSVREEDTGPYVWVRASRGDSFSFRPESWPLIRDKVDALFAVMAESDQETETAGGKS